ncbi:cytochrome C [Azospirillum thiophilum]|uniref:Cytochrome C n=1 Tax=Azospirillum thiophilum TaxID=528244 RepID=A0AAC8ZW16_9PROT|nr:c-type cytochrome [Azospirillum thiophilum]ALG74782.1 cytochrome C [Azospirillum thiophilum]KJR61606.1 cytochrome C [Azospirillum thiophilum]
MSRFCKAALAGPALAVLLGLTAGLLPGGTALADGFPGVGRPATPAEVKAWDIDVGPDFAGLPPGSGTVSRGMDIWEAKCSSCHGTFGESNSVFNPLIGGTTAEDIKSGHVATLKRTDFPARTTVMKVATVSTLYDYIRRAMPWNAPKSLSDDDVYAVLAYMLNLAEIVPDDFVLTDRTIREVQARMPNRNGMTTAHALWPGPGLPDAAAKPDTANTACMTKCKPSVQLASHLPDHALGAHGNLAAQNRIFGPVRGQRTGPDEAAADKPPPALTLAEESGCLSCHAVDTRIVGPSYSEIAARYRGSDSTDALVSKVKAGGEGVWGAVPMPPQPDLNDDQVKTLVAWILAGAPAK